MGCALKVRRRRRGSLDEEHVVFTGRGADRGFCGGGEGGDNGGEDHTGALGGVHGGVQAARAVVVDERHRLAVVGLQPRVQRLLVVITALHQGLPSDLGDGEGGGVSVWQTSGRVDTKSIRVSYSMTTTREQRRREREREKG